MAAIANEIDKILQATVPRFAPPTDRGMFLSPSSAVFKVAGNGTGSPGSITFRATLLNMGGTVTYTATDGLALAISGNDATLAYADMSALSGTITATITVDGVLYTQIATIAKVADGTPGTPSYTWIKYADSSSGAGLSDDPTGKAYIGLAYNKPVPDESTTATDYTWSLIKGTDGIPGAKGADGTTYYTWIKYSDQADGTGLYDTPTASTLYIGIAVNKTAATESTIKTDYVWSKFRGDQGVPGNTGSQGPRGNVSISAATGSSVWVDSEAVAALSAVGYGAPQIRDAVTLHNNAAKFSEERGYTGSAWSLLGAHISGSALIDETVFSRALATGAVTTDKLAVTSQGGVLSDDPFLEDVANAWILPAGVIFQSDASGSSNWSGLHYLACTGTPDAKVRSKRQFIINPAKTYSLTANLYAGGGNNRNMYIFVDFFDKAGTMITGAATGWGGIESGYVFASPPVAQTWSRQGGQFGAKVPGRLIPTNAAYVQIGVWFQYSGSGSGFVLQGAQDIRLEQVVNSVLIEDGAITANKISVQSLSAMTANIGFLTNRVNNSGAGQEIASDNTKVYDASNNLRLLSGKLF